MQNAAAFLAYHYLPDYGEYGAKLQIEIAYVHPVFQGPGVYWTPAVDSKWVMAIWHQGRPVTFTYYGSSFQR